ncbi:hypothetical protein [Chitiniphilus shinanonensis]|uniref:hypothetical protein n=1 Tax=Chitiniphilus shinanonensis TaxID=553088 RepID=UPI003071E6D0
MESMEKFVSQEKGIARSWKCRLWLIGAPILLGCAAYASTFLMEEEYTAELRIAPTKNAPIYAWALRSDMLLNQIAYDLNLASYYGNKSRAQTLKKLGENVKIAFNNKDNFLDVDVTDSSPDMAKKLANAFGSVLTSKAYEMRLVDLAKVRYSLEQKRKLAAESLKRANDALAAEDIKQVVVGISPSEKYGITSLAGILAESSLNGASDLAQSEIAKLQDQLINLHRLVVDGLKNKTNDSGLWISAVTALQEQAYWSSMIERLDRRIELARIDEKEDLKIVWAETPEEKSGPRRGLIAVLATLLGGLIVGIYVFLRESKVLFGR